MLPFLCFFLISHIFRLLSSQPVYSGYDNGLCSNKDNEAAIKSFDVESFGHRNSRCLVGSVRPFYQPTALCLPIACVIQDHSLRIKVENQWHICEGQDQKIFSTTVTIECPDPRRVCPTFFCPYDCLGTDGQCDYESGRCLCEYLNTTGNGEAILDDCGKVQEMEEIDGSTQRTIIRPDEPGRRDPAVPPPDHTLSDYYVADAQSLEEQPLLGALGIALVSLTGILVVSFVAMTCCMGESQKDSATSFLDFFCLFKNRKGCNEGSDNDLPGTDNDSPTNPNKDKMIATVLVDMRIRNNGRWRLRRRQDANESVDETAGRLTESEAASGPESMSDMSSRRSVASSDLDASQDDINIEDLPPEVAEEPQVIRRRRVVHDSHA
jgi:hypothetical protein